MDACDLLNRDFFQGFRIILVGRNDLSGNIKTLFLFSLRCMLLFTFYGVLDFVIVRVVVSEIIGIC